MLRSRSLSELYPLAIADGGGVALAYAYYVKRLLLARWLANLALPRTHAFRILIAGLPDHDGVLDFLLIAQEAGVTALVVDDRPAALERLSAAVATAQRLNQLQALRFKGLVVNDMGVIWEAATDFSLVLSHGVVERLDGATRAAYLKHLQTIGTAVAVFGRNQALVHHQQTQAPAISPADLRMHMRHNLRTGYIAAPPLTKTLSLSTLIRESQISDRLRRILFYSLELNARSELLTPATLRARQARLVYGLWQTV